MWHRLCINRYTSASNFFIHHSFVVRLSIGCNLRCNRRTLSNNNEVWTFAQDSVDFLCDCVKKLLNRAMALSISLMFGRLGGVAGTNTAAFLLDNYCDITFYSSGLILIGLFYSYQSWILIDFIRAKLLHFFSAMGVLSFYIPDIHKKAPKADEPWIDLDSSALSVKTTRYLFIGQRFVFFVK